MYPTPFLHYYGIAFLDVVEVSSVPLIPVSCVMHDAAVEKYWPSVLAVCTPLFALLFFAVRLVFWPIMSYHFWRAAFAHWSAGTLHSVPVMGLFCLSNVCLTTLQFMWGGDILRAAMGTSSSKVEAKRD